MTHGITFGDPVWFIKKVGGITQTKVVTSFALIETLRKSGWTETKKPIPKTKKTQKKED